MSNDRARDQEQGLALVLALFALLLITAAVVMMFRSAQFEIWATGNASASEAALHAADAGAEVVFGRMNHDNDYTTGHTAPEEPFASDAAERAWVLAQTVLDEAWIDTARGRGYGIGPIEMHDRKYVYGVGITGRLDDPQAMRVVRTEILPAEGGLDGAGVLAGGSILFHEGGSTQVTGGVHTNQTLYADQNMSIDGDLSASEDIASTHPQLNVSGQQLDGVPERHVPEVYAIELHQQHAGNPDLVWYDLCRGDSGSPRDGIIRAPATPGEPCTGEQVGRVGGNGTQRWSGWTYDDTSRTWTQTNGHNPAGVFYAHELNLHLHNTSNQRRATFIASADWDDEGRSGNVVAGSTARAYLEPWAILADRDIDGSEGGSKRIDGIMYAGEQIDATGGFDLTGSMIMRDDEHTPYSPVHENRFGGGGNTTIEFVPAYDIFARGTVHVYAWRELFGAG
jgi:hypothetical protein